MKIKRLTFTEKNKWKKLYRKATQDVVQSKPTPSGLSSLGSTVQVSNAENYEIVDFFGGGNSTSKAFTQSIYLLSGPADAGKSSLLSGYIAQSFNAENSLKEIESLKNTFSAFRSFREKKSYCDFVESFDYHEELDQTSKKFSLSLSSLKNCTIADYAINAIQKELYLEDSTPIAANYIYGHEEYASNSSFANVDYATASLDFSKIEHLFSVIEAELESKYEKALTLSQRILATLSQNNSADKLNHNHLTTIRYKSHSHRSDDEDSTLNNNHFNVNHNEVLFKEVKIYKNDNRRKKIPYKYCFCYN